MMISKSDSEVLIDLIENKLHGMQVSDRDELRQMIALQRVLGELKGIDAMQAGVLKDFSEIPRRGRRRKVGDIMGERV